MDVNVNNMELAGGGTLSPRGVAPPMNIGCRAGVLETHVRGQWHRVYVQLEEDCLSITLDETCDAAHFNTTTTTLNGDRTNTLTHNNNNCNNNNGSGTGESTTPGAVTPGGGAPTSAADTPDVPDSIANQNRCVRVCKSDNNGLGISIKVLNTPGDHTRT